MKGTGRVTRTKMAGIWSRAEIESDYRHLLVSMNFLEYCLRTGLVVIGVTEVRLDKWTYAETHVGVYDGETNQLVKVFGLGSNVTPWTTGSL